MLLAFFIVNLHSMRKTVERWWGVWVGRMEEGEYEGGGKHSLTPPLLFCIVHHSCTDLHAFYSWPSLTPVLLVACSICSQSHSYAYLFCVLPHWFWRKRETERLLAVYDDHSFHLFHSLKTVFFSQQIILVYVKCIHFNLCQTE